MLTDIQRIAARKLKMLNDAVELNDLQVPPANRLEALKGGRKGQPSIRINDQWRLCFRWQKANASDVEIVKGKRAITADTALRLGHYFGNTAQFWLTR